MSRPLQSRLAPLPGGRPRALRAEPVVGRVALAVGLIVATSGCRQDDRHFTECQDAACRERFVRQAVERGELQQAGSLVSEIQEPVEQIALVTALVEEDPGGRAGLCRALHLGPGRSRCELITSRPHLWAEPEAASRPGSRSAPGPASRDVLPSETRSRFADVAPATADCSAAPEPASCIARSAREAAFEGRLARTVALCRGTEGEKWQQECSFEVAEALMRHEGRRGYPDAVDLCLVTGPFAANCLAHLTMALLPRQLDPTTADAQAWADSIEDAEAIEAFWQERDPSFAPVAVDRFWSEVVTHTYASAPGINGRALDALPAAALPHVHAAAAMRLVVREQATARGLAEWAERLDSLLATTDPPPPSMEAPAPLAFIADRWPEDLGDEGSRPAAFYLSTSRRTVARDPSEDRLICLLEAIARVELAGATALLEEAVSHESDAVSWTATRLLEERVDDSQHRPDMVVGGQHGGGPGAGGPGAGGPGGPAAGSPGPPGSGRGKAGEGRGDRGRGGKGRR